jgi:hypothetical protein
MPDRHPDFAVGKPVHGDFLQGKAESIRQPPRIGDAGRQALDRELVQGVTWPCFAIA